MLLGFDPAVTAVTCGWPVFECGDYLWHVAAALCPVTG
jgi:hypothetical protein